MVWIISEVIEVAYQQILRLGTDEEYDITLPEDPPPALVERALVYNDRALLGTKWRGFIRVLERGHSDDREAHGLAQSRTGRV